MFSCNIIIIWRFKDFLDLFYFCKILNLKSFVDSWGTSYIQPLMIIIYFRFTCGDRKIYQNVKKCQHILWRIVGMKGPNLPILWGPPFSNFIQPHFPVASYPHPNCSFCCLVSLTERVIVAPHLMRYFTYDIKDLYMSSIGTLVPERPWCVFYGTRHQVYWVIEVWQIVWFFLVLWFDITHPKTCKHTETQHTLGPVGWHTHIKIYLHHLLCAHSNYLY